LNALTRFTSKAAFASGFAYAVADEDRLVAGRGLGNPKASIIAAIF
jgi:hypothetical protein